MRNLASVELTTCAKQLAAKCPKRNLDKQCYQLVDMCNDTICETTWLRELP